MTDKCWFCGYEGYLPTGWKTDEGEKLICPECDWRLDQILKHFCEDCDPTPRHIAKMMKLQDEWEAKQVTEELKK